MTSHAAVVARGMGKCCVSGCGAIVMDEENKQFTLSGKTLCPPWTPASAATSAASWAGPISIAA